MGKIPRPSLPCHFEKEDSVIKLDRFQFPIKVLSLALQVVDVLVHHVGEPVRERVGANLPALHTAGSHVSQQAHSGHPETAVESRAVDWPHGADGHVV